MNRIVSWAPAAAAALIGFASVVMFPTVGSRFITTSLANARVTTPPNHRPAGPLPVANPAIPAGPASSGDPAIAVVQFAMSKPVVPLARPLPLFSDAAPVIVPPGGLSTEAPTVPATVTFTVLPTTTTTVAVTKATTTTRAPKRGTVTTVTTAPPPATTIAPPVVVPPEGLVLPAIGSPTTIPATVSSLGLTATTLVFVPLPPSTAVGAPTTALPTVAPTTIVPTTVATTRPPTTAPRPTTTTSPPPTTLVFVPLAPSTVPPTVPPTVTTAPAAPRVGVGPRPTIVVRPVTEGRDAPPLPAGETPLPTVAPTGSEPRTFTFVGAEGPAPARHPGADAAVAEALSHLGVPYVWAAEGPDGFDCSGLSLVAWRAAGVTLPHQSRSQFVRTVRINLADIAPGDLLFFGDPIHHLGIYVGDGKMVEAAKPGTNVKVSTIKRRDLVGIGRVTG